MLEHSTVDTRCDEPRCRGCRASRYPPNCKSDLPRKHATHVVCRKCVSRKHNLHVCFYFRAGSPCFESRGSVEMARTVHSAHQPRVPELSTAAPPGPKSKSLRNSPSKTHLSVGSGADGDSCSPRRARCAGSRAGSGSRWIDEFLACCAHSRGVSIQRSATGTTAFEMVFKGDGGNSSRDGRWQ